MHQENTNITVKESKSLKNRATDITGKESKFLKNRADDIAPNDSSRTELILAINVKRYLDIINNFFTKRLAYIDIETELEYLQLQEVCFQQIANIAYAINKNSGEMFQLRQRFNYGEALKEYVSVQGLNVLELSIIAGNKDYASMFMAEKLPIRNKEIFEANLNLMKKLKCFQHAPAINGYLTILETLNDVSHFPKVSAPVKTRYQAFCDFLVRYKYQISLLIIGIGLIVVAVYIEKLHKEIYEVIRTVGYGAITASVVNVSTIWYNDRQNRRDDFTDVNKDNLDEVNQLMAKLARTRENLVNRMYTLSKEYIRNAEDIDKSEGSSSIAEYVNKVGLAVGKSDIQLETSLGLKEIALDTDLENEYDHHQPFSPGAAAGQHESHYFPSISLLPRSHSSKVIGSMQGRLEENDIEHATLTSASERNSSLSKSGLNLT